MKKEKRKTLVIFEFLLLLVIIAGIPLYIYFFHHDIIEMFTSVDDIRKFLLENRNKSIIIYLAAQVFQQIFCVIPGQPFQFVAGYLFGTPFALLLSVAGVFIGSTITFFLGRVLGHDFLYTLFGESKVAELISKLDTKKGYFVLFLFYFIPGFPKDMVSYIAGLSGLKWIHFIIISMVARILPMTCSIIVGDFSEDQKWILVGVIAVLVAAVTIYCIRNKDKILALGDRIYERLMRL